MLLKNCWHNFLKLSSKHGRAASCENPSLTYMFSTGRAPPHSASLPLQSMLQDVQDTPAQPFHGFTSMKDYEAKTSVRLLSVSEVKTRDHQATITDHQHLPLSAACPSPAISHGEIYSSLLTLVQQSCLNQGAPCRLLGTSPVIFGKVC